MLEVGTLLDGKYKILNEIGHGGMSVVYLALNERANKTWAVKEVRKDGGNDEEVVSQGLVAETEMLKKLSHPNLPAIIDVIDREDSFIIVMDYIEGKSLQDVVNASGPQDAETVVEWARQLCDVLGYLHSRRPPIIYRDMKPANVMLRPDGQVALIDFGTAREYKLTSKGDTTWLGTRGYAAPEQFGGHGQTDARTDIYNLGATIYHLLTGYSPADTQFVIYPVGQLRPELAGSGIEKVVKKCCEPEPANRYQNCAELMYALDHVHDEDDAVRKSRSIRWAAFVTAAAVTLAGIAGMAVFKTLENRTLESSYDQLIVRAGNVKNEIEEFAENMGKAMDLKPEEPEPYNALLDGLVYNDVTEGENKFTAKERELYQACINRNYAGRKNSNIEILKNQKPSDYEELRYKMGVDYYSFCTNGLKEANTYMNEIKAAEFSDDQRQAEEKKATRDVIITLTDYYTKLDQGSDSFADTSYSYKGLWDELKQVEEAKQKEATGKLALLYYRMAVVELAQRAGKFARDGVSEDEMTAMVNDAKQYADNLPTNGEYLDNLKNQVLAGVNAAKDGISSYFGNSFVM